MSKIKSVKAREILDSRGNPTVEVEIALDNKLKAWASVPSGASTGTHEALELRDGGKRYNGKGVLKAVNNINRIIALKIKGMSPKEQTKIDQIMLDLDKTDNKAKLGANAILGVSLAVARAGALASNYPLYKYLKKKYFKSDKLSFPMPTMNILNGGAHAGWSIDIQEFMVVPKQKNIKEAVRCGAEIFHSLKKILQSKNFSTTVGDEGGYAPKLKSNDEALSLMMNAVKSAGYKSGLQVGFAIDSAASEFYNKTAYNMKADKKKRTAKQMIEMYKRWLASYPILSLEDGLAEDDWTNWDILTKELGKKVDLVGDDLFVTNVDRLKKGINEGVGNAILIKLNQIGSLTETIDCIKLAKKNNYKISISHRSGETVDDFIADLAVASGAQYIKSGSLSRGERIAKYNRLTEIWDEINN